jgi:UPF0755 protein
LSEKKNKKINIFSIIIKLISFFIMTAIILVIVFLGLIMYFNSPAREIKPQALLSYPDGIRQTEEDSFLIDVRRGESAQSVGLRLERAGLISSRYFWNLLCRLEKEHIKSGTYKLEANLSQIAIHRLLISGKQILQRVTIREGVTLSKAAAALEDAGVCSAADFLSAARNPEIIGAYKIPNLTMEGYLFPDTYFFPMGYPAEDVIKSMADTFFRRIELIYPSVVNITARELNEKVIIASIVEREYRIAEEAPLMAGVFYNRLRINMGLQSCATVEYIITEIMGLPHPRIITTQDTEIRNPYNTYVWAGLPPGPVSMPGAVALNAAFFPERTEYFYFRLEDVASGKHYFSRTLDEHISAGRLVPKGQN